MREEAVVEIFRAGQIESRHKVSFAIVDVDGHVRSSWGDPDLVTYLRSSAKPLQAIPFVESGAADHFEIEPEELALACASHTGMQMHVDKARHILRKTGVSEDALQCGTHIPYSYGAYEELLRSGGKLEQVRNNCSGKHAAMLATAKYLGEDLTTYLEPAHPVQERIIDVLAGMSGVAARSIIVGIDGCSAPTFALPLRSAALAYARFADAISQEGRRAEVCRRMFQAMTSHPEHVAGPDRFDTRFMLAVDGRMLSKSGAEGFQSLAIPGNAIEQGSPSLGIAIKVHDGDDKEHGAAALIAIELVDQIGGFRPGEREKLAMFDNRERVNLRDIVVGEVRINPSLLRDFDLNYERR